MSCPPLFYGGIIQHCRTRTHVSAGCMREMKSHAEGSDTHWTVWPTFLTVCCVWRGIIREFWARKQCAMCVYVSRPQRKIWNISPSLWAQPYVSISHPSSPAFYLRDILLSPEASRGHEMTISQTVTLSRKIKKVLHCRPTWAIKCWWAAECTFWLQSLYSWQIRQERWWSCWQQRKSLRLSAVAGEWHKTPR